MTLATLHGSTAIRMTNRSVLDDQPKLMVAARRVTGRIVWGATSKLAQPKLMVTARGASVHYVSTTSASQYRISRIPDTNSPTTENLFTMRLSDSSEFICQARSGCLAYLKEAMDDLLHVQEEAEEEGWAAPSDDTMKMAERVFGDMFSYAPRPYAIYAMPGGAIAVDAHSPEGSKVVVLCDPNGGARCLLYLDGEFESRDYHDPSVLPDDFVKDALRKTGARS